METRDKTHKYNLEEGPHVCPLIIHNLSEKTIRQAGLGLHAFASFTNIVNVKDTCDPWYISTLWRAEAFEFYVSTYFLKSWYMLF